MTKFQLGFTFKKNHFMKNLLHFTTIIFMFGFFNPIIAQNPVKWEFKTKKIDDSTAYFILEATIPNDWKVYGSLPYLEADNDNISTILIGKAADSIECNDTLGPTCLEIEYEENKEMLIGQTTSTQRANSGFCSVFQVQTVFYKDKIELRQKFKYIPNQRLKGYVYFMTSNNEKCMPPKYIDFSVEFPE